MTTYDNLWQHMTTFDNLRQLMTAYDNSYLQLNQQEECLQAKRNFVVLEISNHLCDLE